jgi:hypothetical protein
MAVFVAQSDESGSGDNTGVFLVGGCVSAETNWGPYADGKRPVRTVFLRQSKLVILEEWEVRGTRKF